MPSKAEEVLKTRDIPTLINPSPRTHQLGLQSPPLRQIPLTASSVETCRLLIRTPSTHARTSEPLWLHISCTHHFQGLHRMRCVHPDRLHINVHCRVTVRVMMGPP